MKDILQKLFSLKEVNEIDWNQAINIPECTWIDPMTNKEADSNCIVKYFFFPVKSINQLLARVKFKKGGIVPKHYHPDLKEMVTVTKGVIKINNLNDLKEDDHQYFPINTVHSYECVSEEGEIFVQMWRD